MDAHSVPKNISEFEFHLVGDMTLRQFAYLALGLGTAYLLFVFVSSSAPIIAWPLIVLSSSLGAAFAFLPIMERPLDHWSATFFRAIFSPTKRIYKSRIVNKESPHFKNRLNIYLNSLEPSIQTIVPIAPAPKPTTRAEFVTQPHPNVPKLPPSFWLTPSPKKQAKSSLPTAQELSETVELARRAQLIQVKIVETEKTISDIRTKLASPGVNREQYTRQFEETLSNLEGLTKEASEISRELAVLAKSPAPSVPSTKVRIVAAPPKEAEKNIVLTTTPNIINGIVTDSQGNYLDGVIVVTHDKAGIPVRALKTNKLGQFLAATPLGNGIYTITLEKDGLLFDTLEIKLDGEILAPIKVAAKKGG